MRKPAPVPERRYRRKFASFAGRLLLRTFTHSSVHGAENFPRSGPFIVAGNHRGIMEVFLMVAICPRNIEVLGAGDIPLDPRYRYLADFYGYIPYKRGQMDRVALMTAEHVLKHGRVVGIFPEGGIWKAGRKTAHRGVSWLSFTSGAPVIPVGFGGVYRAVERAIRLERPILETYVGPTIQRPPRDHSVTRRTQMETHAEAILDTIDALIPEWDQDAHPEPEFEEHELQLWVSTGDGNSENRASALCYPELLARFFHLPVLIDVLYTNLNRKGVRPFRRLRKPHSAAATHFALCVILGYVERTNPAFFTYRLGEETAAQLMEALRAFRDLCDQLIAEGQPETPITVIPIRRYRMAGEQDVTEVRDPPPINRF